MKFDQLRLPTLALAILGLAVLVSSASLAQVPSFGAPAVPPGAAEAATDAAADAVKPAARKAKAKKPVKRKAKKAKAPRGEAALRGGAIVVSNKRDSNLLELTATPQNGGSAITIARDVAAGGRATGKLPPKSGCVFSLSGTFDDESTMDAPNMNLCKDGRINLVE